MLRRRRRRARLAAAAAGEEFVNKKGTDGTDGEFDSGDEDDDFGDMDDFMDDDKDMDDDDLVSSGIDANDFPIGTIKNKGVLFEKESNYKKNLGGSGGKIKNHYERMAKTYQGFK